jgi:hypothetical protein
MCYKGIVEEVSDSVNVGQFLGFGYWFRVYGGGASL